MKTTTQTMPLAIAPVKGVKHHEKKANINLFYPVHEYSERLFFYIFLGLFFALSLMHLCGIFLYGEHELALIPI